MDRSTPLSDADRLAMRRSDELVHRFGTRPLVGDMPTRVSEIRAEAIELAKTLQTCAPECREKSLALTALEEAVMWAVKAVANGPDIWE